jgi:hypothetical protein
MFVGAALLGVHMALTHSTITAMVAYYMPYSSVPGIGKLGGTAVSFTDFLLGGQRLQRYVREVVLDIGCRQAGNVGLTDFLLGRWQRLRC